MRCCAAQTSRYETPHANTTDESSQMQGYYRPFRRDRNRHGGGICIYVKNYIQAVGCTDLENNNLTLTLVPHPLQGALYCIGCSLAGF